MTDNSVSEPQFRIVTLSDTSYMVIGPPRDRDDEADAIMLCTCDCMSRAEVIQEGLELLMQAGSYYYDD